MIPIARVALESELARRLNSRTAELKGSNADSTRARAAWRSASALKNGIRDHLARMAPGIQRCMYCGDSLGTDIDHFEPIKEFPAGTFEWLNHLLACSACNSNEKRDQFPRDPSGHALLIDPTRDDPGKHLRLVLRTGEYRALTQRGTASIKVFNLNRADLTRGRAIAFDTRGAVLSRAHDLLRSGRHDEAARCLRALAEEPHASVLNEMLRTVDMPGAPEILGKDITAALKNQLVLATLREATEGTATSATPFPFGSAASASQASDLA